VLDYKQRETDNLKAQMQVINSTQSRLKSHQLLMNNDQDQKAQSSEFAKSKATSNIDVLSEEVQQLQLDFQAKSSKLESLSDVYRAQQQVIALSHSVEDQLMRLIEEVICQTNRTYDNIASCSEKIYTYGNEIIVCGDLQALDLAGMEKLARSYFVEHRKQLDDLSLLIPHARVFLEEKRLQLKAWKKRRLDRICVRSGCHTPQKREQGCIPESPKILESFNTMKSILTTEFLSPQKSHVTDNTLTNAFYLKQVVFSLENQIDILLQDLKIANEALNEKDKMFADLEELLIFNESKKHLLEKENESKAKKIKSLQDRLKQEIYRKKTTENELAILRDGISNTNTAALRHTNASMCKVAASRILLNAIDGRANAAKAVAFRQWACQTCALRAVAKQGNAAALLARQLEETREKLIVLKRHLKKTRRGPREFSGLDSIVETSNETM
jgi:chromosome segregation ATPase